MNLHSGTCSRSIFLPVGSLRRFHVRVPGQGGQGLGCRASNTPEKGYFRQIDPKTDVVPPLRKKKVDINEKGDRWSSDYIWNSDWKSEMEYEEAKQKQEEEVKKQEEMKTSGFLSFGRVADLNDMSVDLTKELQRSKEQISVRKEMAEKASTSKPADWKNMKKLPYIPGSSREGRQRARQERFLPATGRVEDADGYERSEEAMAAYEKEKIENQLWTLGLLVCCFALAYFNYPQDTAVSYLVGALGGLWYLRLLNRGVDSLGTGDTGSISSQPRLLVPAILVLGYNRWNELAAEDVGVTLELLPMLVGFFTYKVALVSRQSLKVFSDIVTDLKKNGSTEATSE